MHGLLETGFLQSVEEWQIGGGPLGGGPLGGGPLGGGPLGGGPLGTVSRANRWPTFHFPDGDRLREQLEQHAARAHHPNILWVEGLKHPPCLETVFRQFPSAFKLVYSKHWEPWEGERLDAYDLVLVDESTQVERLRARYPTVQCGVWDKLIDYDSLHRPLHCAKIFDVCYVAYLKPRKNHGLLFRSLAALGRPDLKCVCVGADRKGYRAELERLARTLSLNVEFTGEVNAETVNRYINRSRIGVMCSSRDAAPRAILEYMAADVPVLVNSELEAGARYVDARAGIVRAPDRFAASIAELLANCRRYSPRDALLARFSKPRVLSRFTAILDRAGCGTLHTQA